ncbi:beta-ribofuranosylaminobenzene 5'-phosphate synthase [Methanococcoides methylutens]|uniref:Beta-ribofuranosylaminobenzene 5'-phosphate synthase n=1 Tax=Methanococcoides methylutens TaxID=2226 RepID=A0A099T2A9_METMT|nr:beta-ribofuranosylaminobenzene 5'-phosphate synthase [Methanococcoides methylutens]KGK98371.1 beta-ribofuranosylaminobenzene 5'-phosphate synthase [Methanococcoides methylutens]
MIKIRSPSRLHLSLIDMNAELGRVDGGVGITLDSPNITLSAEKHDGIEITGGSSLSDRVHAAVEALLPEGEGVKVHVEEDMPPHVGLGSGTQIALSAAAAVNELYDLGLSVNELAIRVGRGGTSGIGVASFENGGFLVDCGHKFSDKGSFSPSSASRADPAPVIFRHDFPEWDIILALPDSKGAHDAQEVDIFKKECPIPLQEVQEVSHVVLMQMMPSIIEGDIENFGMALNHLQSVGFKKREVALQSPAVRDLIEFMQDLGAAGAGMSSFGPVVFGIVDHRRMAEQIRKEAQLFLDDTVGGNVVLTRANNSGAKIWKD